MSKESRIIRAVLTTTLVLAALELCLAGSPFVASASGVMVVKDTEIKPYRDAIEGFKSSCNCTVDEFDLGDVDAIEHALKERPDAVVAVGTRTFRKIRTIDSVPLIYAMVLPSETNDVTQENISGVSMDIAPDAYLDSITGLFPDAKRIGVLAGPEHTGPFLRDSQTAAAGRGITLVAKTVRDSHQLLSVLNELKNRIDVLWMLPGEMLSQPDTVDYLMLFSFQNNLPLFSFSRKYVVRGAAAALTISPYDLGVETGELARQLIQKNWNRPKRLYAAGPRLIVNKKVCEKLGVRLNDEVLRRAEAVE